MFGINDGLVTNLSLVMFFTGATVDNKIIVLAGVAGLLAGAFSMSAGEYVSMRVQRELFERLIHLEAHELATEPEEEREELIGIYQRKGVPVDVAEGLVEVIHKDPKLALENTMRWRIAVFIAGRSALLEELARLDVPGEQRLEATTELLADRVVEPALVVARALPLGEDE